MSFWFLVLLNYSIYYIFATKVISSSMPLSSSRFISRTVYMWPFPNFRSLPLSYPNLISIWSIYDERTYAVSFVFTFWIVGCTVCCCKNDLRRAIWDDGFSHRANSYVEGVSGKVSQRYGFTKRKLFLPFPSPPSSPLSLIINSNIPQWSRATGDEAGKL